MVRLYPRCERRLAGYSASSVEELKTIILKYYTEFIECGEVTYNGISEEINKYTHYEMTKAFVSILNSELEKGFFRKRLLWRLWSVIFAGQQNR